MITENGQGPTVPSRALPLTEPRGAAECGASEADIRALVDSFYESVRRDDVLGPVFARHVRDWSLHLPKMYDFWSTVVLRTGRYAGRPFDVHRAIPGLSPAHFERWLALWEATVARAFSREETRAAFVVAARRMGASMVARL